MDSNRDDYLIKKHVLHPGKKFVPFKDGTKITFHFQTYISAKDTKSTLLDDSHKIGNKEPMVLVLGKKFKLEVWEAILQKMALGEVARFHVDKSLVYQYPFVSKTLRDLNKDPRERRSHCCSMTLQNEGLGYNDLDALIQKPSDLEFIIEILKIESPEEYEKENWQLNDKEAIEAIPKLKERGNDFFHKKDYIEAAKAYGTAIELCEKLMIKERRKDEEWQEIDKLRLPLLLNYSQCKLLEKDYYAVIAHCTTVLESDEANVKALYRRGVARGHTWQLQEGRGDLQRAVSLRPSLANDVNKILNEWSRREKETDAANRGKLSAMFR